MLVLGIESSCDETAVAIVDSGRRVLSSVVASQIAKHAQFGGVIPEIAAREHLAAIGPLLDTCLDEAKVRLEDIGAVAVTQGPGLIGPLLVGVAFARALAASLKIPVVPVDHVHAHVFGTLLSVDHELDGLFPALSIVVSGGHTNVYRMAGPTQFKLLGFSVDDACGECFDKVGKMLGLPYPGGPEIELRARQGNDAAIQMPNLSIPKNELRFSFSGLKTFMLNTARTYQNLDDQTVADLCASFQKAAFKQIVTRLNHEWSNFGNYKSLIIAGGVAANQAFRKMLAAGSEKRVVYPLMQFCGDNAAMVACYGSFLLKEQSLPLSHQYWEPYSTYRYEQVQ